MQSLHEHASQECQLPSRCTRVPPVVSTWSCLRQIDCLETAQPERALSLSLSPSLSLSHNLWLGVEDTVLSRSAWQGVQHRVISREANPKHVAPSQMGLEFVAKAV